MISSFIYHLTWYLAIGAIVTLGLDLSLQKSTDLEQNQFTNQERIASILLWPISLASFIYHTIRILRK